MFNIYGGATEFKQWELDKFVTNPCMKEGDEVVFRNSHGETYVVKAFAQNGEILADVPNYLLRTADNILVDLGQGLERHTECRTTFTVVAQDKPEGYECKYNVPDRPEKISGGVSSWNDLTDKPFGETTTVKEVLAECQPVYAGDGMYQAALASAPDVVVGEKYIVTYNGVDYPCEAVDGSALNMPGLAAMGDVGGATGGTSTGEPFVVLVGSDGDGESGLIAAPMDGSTTLTISIRQEVTEVTTIDPKFLPSGIGAGTVIKLKHTDSGITCDDYTAAEVYEMLSNDPYTRLGLEFEENFSLDYNMVVYFSAVSVIESNGVFLATFFASTDPNSPIYKFVVITPDSFVLEEA